MGPPGPKGDKVRRLFWPPDSHQQHILTSFMKSSKDHRKYTPFMKIIKLKDSRAPGIPVSRQRHSINHPYRLYRWFEGLFLVSGL